MVDTLSLSSRCLMIPCGTVCLHFVMIVVFPDHTHLLYVKKGFLTI